MRTGAIKLTFTDILFIIIILVVVAGGIIYYLKMQQRNKLSEFQQKRDDLMNISITDQLFLLKNMSLSGQTKRKYESLSATWQTITNFQFTEIESALVGAEQYIEHHKFMKAGRSLDHVTELLEDTAQQIHELGDELSQLVKVEQLNSEQNEALHSRYNEARKKIMNQSFDYGPAIETLEKNLQHVELNFTKYSELATEGDYLEAQSMLQTIESDLTSLEDILERIPTMYKQIKETYEEQIEEIREKYQELVADKYNFDGVNIPERVDEAQEKLDEAKAVIKTADLMEARTLMDKAERAIQDLYDIMETEMAARRYVNKEMPRLHDLLQEVRDESRYAGIEVDRIAQSYILHENELERVAELTDQLVAEYNRAKDMAQEIESSAVIYTTMKDNIKKIRKRVEEISNQFVHIVQGLNTLALKEKDIKKNLDMYEVELRNLKRRVEKSHLPGLNEDFFTKFYQVTNQIENLSRVLNKVRVDIEEVEMLEEQLAENFEQLDVLTEEIIDSANLTEYMIQQSNRYRYDYQEVDQAIQEAQYLFHQEYRYSEALAVIEKTLRRVDQEAPTQVRRMYHQEKQRRGY